MWTDGVEIDPNALNQLRNTASLPFVFRHVAVMPDVHFGIGATVGSVVPTKGAIVPACIGVDIGCGMLAALLPIKAEMIPDNLKKLREDIEWSVPVGRFSHKPERAPESWWKDLALQYNNILVKHPKIGRDKRPLLQLGTLGGGNHFIEICVDNTNYVWIMLHSGSRNVGNVIGHYFIDLAKQDMRRHFINLPDQDLAYLPEGTQYFNDYVEAVEWAQTYAHFNRQIMFQAIYKALRNCIPHLSENSKDVEMLVNCHHNYVAREHHFGENVFVTRKGAVRAREGDLGIIPGSMGARSYIVRGKGNKESFESCSHGAGRRMSRSEARRRFTKEDHIEATEGVECRKDEGVIDETPGAYKSIDAVIAAQTDLIDVVAVLKQVICIKG